MNVDVSNSSTPQADVEDPLSIRLVSILSCVLAGLVAGLFIVQFYPFFTLPEHLAALVPTSPPELLAEQFRVSASQAKANAGMCFGLAGLLVGIAAGFRLDCKYLGNVFSGALLGGLFGFGAGPLGLWAWHKLCVESSLGLTGGTVASHVIAWGLTGLGVGLGSRLFGSPVTSRGAGIVQQGIRMTLAGAASGLLYVPTIVGVSLLVPTLNNVVTEMYIPDELPAKIVWATTFGVLCGMTFLTSPRKTQSTDSNSGGVVPLGRGLA